MKLGMQVGLGPSHPAPPPQKRGQQSHQKISAHVYCGQTPGWIKMSLGTKVGHGIQLPSIRGIATPIFSPRLLWPNSRPSLWPPCVAHADIIFLPCGFFLLSSFFYSSPNLSGRRLDVYHTSTHGVALVRI